MNAPQYEISVQETFSQFFPYFLFISEKKNLSDISSCQCGQLHKYHKPSYSYCKTWFSSLPPLCFLKGGSSARNCPGARKLKGTERYLTSDESICNASRGKIHSLHFKNCNLLEVVY